MEPIRADSRPTYCSSRHLLPWWRAGALLIALLARPYGWANDVVPRTLLGPAEL
jgi:hypothetical protein